MLQVVCDNAQVALRLWEYLCTVVLEDVDADGDSNLDDFIRQINASIKHADEFDFDEEDAQLVQVMIFISTLNPWTNILWESSF